MESTNIKIRDILNSLKHFTKSVHLNGGKDFKIGRETLQVYPHLPQAVCVVGGCGFLIQNLLLHWIGRKIAEDRALLRWLPRSPDPTPSDVFFWRYFEVSLYCFYHRTCLRCETNHCCLFRNQSWHGAAGVAGNGLSACCLCVTKGGHTEHLGGIQKICRISISISRLHITILSTIQEYRFCEMCQGILNTVDFP
jgi:hypothetical protein